MINIIDSPEKLWQECSQLSKTPSIIFSELYDENNSHFVLAYGPVAQRNQYQELLYSAKNKFNVSILPIRDFQLFGEIPWPGKVICHFHWIHGVTSQAKSVSQAEASVLFWEKLLNQIKKNGHKIVWTVHNVLPHDSIWPEYDIKIHQMMSDAADGLHVMAKDSVEQTKPYYKLHENKLFLVPHSTYQGAQIDEISPEAARKQLEFDQDDFVFLSFGAIMEYKGFDYLMAAYDKVRNNSLKKTRLIIAGLPTDKSLVSLILAWGEGKPDVTLDLTPVANDKLQVYFRSANIAVCPYRRTMNSGAAMMAMTFDLPVIGPNIGGFADLINDGCAYGYKINDQKALISVMETVLSNGVDLKKQNIKLRQSFLSPQKISTEFFNKIYNL
jgi:beta-1,4-mannosyltransferase